MPTYTAPLADFAFVLFDVMNAEQEWQQCQALKELDRDTGLAILAEGARLAEAQFLPVNQSADEQGCHLGEDGVVTPDGYAQAYQAYQEGGWLSLSGAVEYGGQGLPKLLTVALDEVFYSANSALNLFPALTNGACVAIAAHASEDQKQRYLPRMYAGEWTGAMALTEGHAGSDLGILRTKAEPLADGRYAITGTKIFITAGDHDLAQNIVHLVLARLPDAPAGSKGISLFIVPRNEIDESGNPGARNNMSAGALEKKMGIHGSPTCVMNYDGAVGEIVGEPGDGLKYMFTMMNYERLSIGVQGLATGVVAYQNALEYAHDRRQGRAATGPVDAQAEADPLTVHADVRRMLLTGKAFSEGGRALAAYVGLQLDRAKYADDEAVRRTADARVALLTPVVKAFLTDRGFDVCVVAQQVFGGHGYIREWGVEQFVRDARIAQIYEGTNGIQAQDLTARKVIRDGGAGLNDFLAELEADLASLSDAHRELVTAALAGFRHSTNLLISGAGSDAELAGAVSVDYLDFFALVIYGWLWGRMASVAQTQRADNEAQADSKQATADFFMARLLPRWHALAAAIDSGSETLIGDDVEQALAL